MKFTRSWASLALLSTTSVLAQDAPTSTTSSASETSTCTAFLINKLCDYPSPGPEFAVASSSEQHCWQYCNAHQPCSFGIFALGNPYTKTGTCWLYPGQFFDESLGTGGCNNPYLSVFAKPVCSDPNPTPTSTAAAECAAATSSPSAMASICNYPPPDATCFSDCYASSGASNCLDICAKAESCAYAVFNPHSESMSPYSSGTCWVYPNGTFDEGKATSCEGKPEQYVYENKCPKLEALGTPEAETSSTSAVEAKVSGAVAENATADEKVNGGGDGAQNSGSVRVLSGAWVVVGVAVGVLFC